MDDEVLEELLVQWSEACDAGQPSSAAQLCHAVPHLQARLEVEIQIQERWERFAASASGPDHQSRSTAHRDDAPPSPVLGDYELFEKIGAGGMGQVFKAQHRHMKRLVAIKLLPTTLTQNTAAVQRFQREIQAAAKLTHPNIVTAYDARMERGLWYLVMEYIAGCDLATLIHKQGPLSVPMAVDCIRQAARGLAFAHTAGVIHRDIKPSNLILDKQGVIKILDLGLARLELASDVVGQQLTDPQHVMGTVDYLAPEQAASTRDADERSDVYSLGCTLYRLLTGMNVYEGDTVVKKLYAHHYHPIPSICSQRQEVPSDIDRIFQKMVAKQPADRYQQMIDLATDLDACYHSVMSTAIGQRAADLTRDQEDGSHSVGRDQARPASLPVALDDNRKLARLDSEIEIDPHSENAMPVHRPTSTSRDLNRRNQEPVKRLAGGVGGLILLALLSVWVIVRGQHGDETAQTKVPDGGHVEMQSDSTPKPTRQPSPAILPMKPAPRAPSPTSVGPEPPRAVAPFNAKTARSHQDVWAKHLGTDVVQPNSIGMQMTLIPPGEFLMGSSDADITLALKIADETNLVKAAVRRIQGESPQHTVRITKPFRLCAHEVTIGQFAKFVEQARYKTQAEEFGGNSNTVEPAEVKPDNLKLNWRTPGQSVTDDSPVTQVSWNDAVAFCNWLSEQEKLDLCYQRNGSTWALLPKANGYRLPTEAEWEYACRAGTTTQFWFGDDWKEHDKYGWSSKNAGARPHSVGSLPANPFGLYDMHGNVWEWCHDWYQPNWYEKSPSDDPLGPSGGSSRVDRGGGWDNVPANSRSSYRLNNSTPSFRMQYRGFRPALSSVGAQASPVTVTTSTPPVVALPPVAKPVGPAPPLAKAPFNAMQAKSHQDAWAKHLSITVETSNSVGQAMILIPPGEFLMGSTDEQVEMAVKAAEEMAAHPSTLDRIKIAERPQHKVLISKPFLISATEVTIGQFKKFASSMSYQTEAEKSNASRQFRQPMKAGQPPPKSIITYLNPGYSVTDDSPASVISWNDATAYCKWLSDQEKRTYRLPTEAEWEYACRAGTTTQYSFGENHNELPRYGWFDKNAFGKSHQVGILLSNPFGLFDMHGNLEEWCGDWYDEKWYEQTLPNDPIGSSVGTGRVIRGGYWLYFATYCRSAYRINYIPSYRAYHLGFRCVSEL